MRFGLFLNTQCLPEQDPLQSLDELLEQVEEATQDRACEVLGQPSRNRFVERLRGQLRTPCSNS